MKALHLLTVILLVVGGLNWGLTAFDRNVVEMLLGVGTVATKTVYVLVGLAALYEIVTHKGNCRACSAGPAM